MDRRKFLKGSALLTGLLSLSPSELWSSSKNTAHPKAGKAKNIIFMISDGMSLGTLSMADLYSRNILGKESQWLSLYREKKVSHALMDTASANSIVTDSAAASSAFGGGIRVQNGALNIGANGEVHVPIWQKYKKPGKRSVVLQQLLLPMLLLPASVSIPPREMQNLKLLKCMQSWASMY